MPPGFYFAQMTDLHVGSPSLVSRFAEHHLEEAFRELAALDPRPAFVLVTGDLVSGGTKAELGRYRELAADFPLPLWHQAANHDLWGDADGPDGWDAVMGDRRHCFDHDGVRFVLVHEYKRRDDGSWFAHMSRDDLDWLRRRLEPWGPRPVIVAQHSPILRLGGEYVDVWAGSNADEYLALLAEHNVLAIITGHWHRNMTWRIGPAGASPVGEDATILLVNTGSLLGQQWTGYPPHYWFATRPGYRLFHLEDGRLRSFWRELRANPQVILPWVGPAYTQGPHPQVRVPIVRGEVRLVAQACAFGERVASVEWGLCVERSSEGYKTEWRVDAWKPMECTFDGLWSDWEADFDPQLAGRGELVQQAETAQGTARLLRRAGPSPDEAASAREGEGDYVIALRARSAAGKTACEGTPITVRPDPSDPPAVQGSETVFALFYPPAE